MCCHTESDGDWRLAGGWAWCKVDGLQAMESSFFTPQIIGIGAATLDRLIWVEEFPADEGVTEMRDEATDGGGPVATALCVLAHLGRECLLVDRLGDDPAGEHILRGLKGHGVATNGVSVVAGARSAEAVILVRRRDGARHIVYRRSSAGEPDAESVKPEWLRGARLLHVNGRHEAAARRAVTLAKQAGVRVSFDGGAGRYRETLRDLVVASDILIVARGFAAAFTGREEVAEQLDALFEATHAEVVVITDGARGSWVSERVGARFHQRASAIAEVVDTTGCGDVYHGAFLHGWLEQWELERCATFASDWAAATAGGLGGRWALRSAATGIS